MFAKIYLTAIMIVFVMITPGWAEFCTACGNPATVEDNFCRSCGNALRKQSTEETRENQLTQPENYRTIAAKGNQPQAFQVKSHFLNVGGTRLYRNSYFWIAEVSGSQARVWSLEGPPYDLLIMGWVSLQELENRTTLTPGTVIVCSEPPPPSPSRVIVVERVNFWRNWGPDPFYPYNHRCPYRRRAR